VDFRIVIAVAIAISISYDYYDTPTRYEG
jgi:hypothetical protein